MGPKAGSKGRKLIEIASQLAWVCTWGLCPAVTDGKSEQKRNYPAISAALPPAAAVLMVTVCSVASRGR